MTGVLTLGLLTLRKNRVVDACYPVTSDASFFMKLVTPEIYLAFFLRTLANPCANVVQCEFETKQLCACACAFLNVTKYSVKAKKT